MIPGLTLADGSATRVAIGFPDITPNAQLRLRWNRSAFAALASSVPSSAVATNTALAISAFALPPSLGLPFDAYTLAEYDTFGTADLDFGRLRYGSPFPADWNRVVDSFVGFTVRYLAPGATLAAPLQRDLSSTELLDPATRDNTSLTRRASRRRGRRRSTAARCSATGWRWACRPRSRGRRRRSRPTA